MEKSDKKKSPAKREENLNEEPSPKRDDSLRSLTPIKYEASPQRFDYSNQRDTE